MDGDNSWSSENAALRTNAVAAFQKVAFCQIVVGGPLLALGLTAIRNYDDSVVGPPYFVGAMVVGPLLLLAFLCTLQIIRYTRQYDSSQKAKNTFRCAFQCDTIISMLTFMGLFAGFVMLRLSKQMSADYHFPNSGVTGTDRKTAIFILVLLIMAFLMLALVIPTIRRTSSAYGVIFIHRCGQMIIVNQQVDHQQQRINDQASALQEQNLLLQQQLALQQQQLLFQQQQQQATENYGFIAPLSYESVSNPYPPMQSAPSDIGKM